MLKHALALLLALAAAQPLAAAPRFEVSFPASLRSEAADGRVLLIIAKSNGSEPRFQVGYGPNTQQIFGVDVDGLAPGQAAVIDRDSFGYPRESLAGIPAGDYYVQAVLNVYETFHRADGHTLKLPPDNGEGQHWNSKPGNLYSVPLRVHVDPAQSAPIKIELAKVIPTIEPRADTKYVKHVRIQSDLLTKFWGRPVYIGATVLLPDGFDEHPEARYPVMYYQGHFSAAFDAGPGFRQSPPDPKATGGQKERQEYSYWFHRDWTSGKLPRMLIVTIQHANPFFDDSYAVNSANVGPYGDAIVKELVPYVEKKFRAIGEPWARVLYGGSTGGWEVLAQQVFYPDFYNGAYCFCPDPIDFRAFMPANLYDDKNVYWLEGDWARVPRPGMRQTDGQVLATLGDMNHYELVLGTKSRSGQQFDIWQAVYSPAGADGYPQPIYDKRTGVVDPKVAEYWKEHYDLSYILQLGWETLGPKLIGKLHFTVGDADTFYLDRAVRLLEKFLTSTKDPEHQPYYAGSFDYGAGQPHCYTGGGASLPMITGFYTLNQRWMPVMLERMLATAPPGADVTSWRY